MKNKKLVIFGLGEIAEMAYEYFTKDSDFEVCAFVADKKFIDTEEKRNLPIVDTEQLLRRFSPMFFWLFVAIGESNLNYDRRRIYLKLKSQGYRFASYVSSKAFVWDNVKIGENCLVLGNNTLDPFVTIGDNVVLWCGNHIGHRSVIRAHCFITSHVVVSGFCEIGENCFMGVNSCTCARIRVAKDNVIAMGAVINKNTREDGIYVGNPARNQNISAREYFYESL